MARARRCDVFESDSIGVYHCYNRVVRRSYLCGFDPVSNHDFSYRRAWFHERLKYLANFFAVDVLAYAILSNHYHLVLRNRPDRVRRMSDEDVVRHWLMICPRTQRQPDGTGNPPTMAEVRAEQAKSERVAELRQRLSNPSWLIRQLSQYMGIRCNSEDNMTGHFWEARFGMRRLLDEAAVLACMAYVDLNPIRSGAVDSLEGYEQVSIGERLRTLDDKQFKPTNWLAPVELASPSNGRPCTVANNVSRSQLEELLTAEKDQSLGCVPMTLQDYTELLRWLAKCGAQLVDPSRSDSIPPILQRLNLDPEKFSELVVDFGGKFFTSAGCPASMNAEARRRGRRRLHGPGKRLLAPNACVRPPVPSADFAN